ncbi:MAG: ATP synthase F1 subunit delta [Candidatus Actinomarina sp.]|jgi:F-type H+-transporting ATPase subunit delta|nr:ATP synthase F1 subunit delta [Actinomycetota bacterium]MBL6833564.1 ATP synthase F1 subunit delta [Candidatus Actinomarina sp.]MBL6837297.1 ATP synthase F1 subunit delta [Candidatus Actinomarina sp.]MDB2326412.1 ATP synthase F1 subunit delta [Candidatus Actinomarina sp.]MDB4823404.1 ATP synthase F1 subunit delta [Acidimicrobiia bacterium]
MGTESFSKGLVEIISSSDESAKIEDEFLQVLQALNTNSEALDAFRNFGIPADKKVEAISNIFAKRVTSMTLDLVTLTISQGYADNLIEIEQQVSNYIAEKRGASLAKVVSAIELNESTQNSLKAALKSKLGRDVELSLKVDSSVIGGIKVSIGERTFDGLLSSKFSDIQTVLEGR